MKSFPTVFCHIIIMILIKLLITIATIDIRAQYTLRLASRALSTSKSKCILICKAKVRTTKFTYARVRMGIWSGGCREGSGSWCGRGDAFELHIVEWGISIEVDDRTHLKLYRMHFFLFFGGLVSMQLRITRNCRFSDNIFAQIYGWTKFCLCRLVYLFALPREEKYYY